MTTAKENRCLHCKSPYTFYPSFYGEDERRHLNNQYYCPDCYKVVLEALAQIPVKYEKKFIPSTNYTREAIVQHQEERCSNNLDVRRITVPLYSNDEKKHNVVCEYMPDNEWYMAEWWSHEPEKANISKETWCEVEEVEFKPLPVARPEDPIVSKDFESREDFYKNLDKDLKRESFLCIWFICMKEAGLCLRSELIPKDVAIEHCQIIRKYWLETTGYFKWLPELSKQFEVIGVEEEIPESLIEERSWRLAKNEKLDAKYQYEDDEQPELQRISEQARENTGQTDC